MFLFVIIAISVVVLLAIRLAHMETMVKEMRRILRQLDSIERRHRLGILSTDKEVFEVNIISSQIGRLHNRIVVSISTNTSSIFKILTSYGSLKYYYHDAIREFNVIKKRSEDLKSI